MKRQELMVVTTAAGGILVRSTDTLRHAGGVADFGDRPVGPVSACPNCGSVDLEVYGSRTSTHDRGHYAGWTTTTRRFACTACGAITTVTTRVPAGNPR